VRVARRKSLKVAAADDTSFLSFCQDSLISRIDRMQGQYPLAGRTRMAFVFDLPVELLLVLVRYPRVTSCWSSRTSS
jgi:hypothetical protein